METNSDPVECSRQPGRLKISPYACGRRYLLAQENRSRSLYHDDFSFAFRRGLEICKACPEGRLNAGIAAGASPGVREKGAPP